MLVVPETLFDHVGLFPPVEVSVTDPPGQIVGLLGEIVTVGAGVTATATVLPVTVPHPESTAWKNVVLVNGPVVYGVVVAPAILVHGPLDEDADCHWIFPCDPVSVSVTDCPAHIDVGEMLAVPAIG